MKYHLTKMHVKGLSSYRKQNIATNLDKSFIRIL